MLKLNLTKYVKCDLCGEIFERGIINYLDHPVKCKAAIVDGSFKFYPKITTSDVPDEPINQPQGENNL